MSAVILATGGYDNTINFWDATSGNCYKSLQHADSQVNKLEITSDKKLLAAAGRPGIRTPAIRIYDAQVAPGAPVMQYDNHSNNVTAIGFQKENKWMYSGSEDSTIKIWDIRTPGCKREMICRSPVNTVVLHPNQGELISGDQSGMIQVWDIANERVTCELVPEIGAPIRSLSVAMDGSLMVAANDNGVCYVWKMIRSSSFTQRFEPRHKLNAHPGEFILKALISPDGNTLATTSSDKTVKLWDLKGDDFSLIHTLKGHARWVWDCVFSVDAAFLVTASTDTTAQLWDLMRKKVIRTYKGHLKGITCCALNDSA